MVNFEKQEVKVTGGLEEPSMCLRKTLSRYSARVCRCLDCGFICPSGNTCSTNITQLHRDTQMTCTPVYIDKDIGKHKHTKAKGKKYRYTTDIPRQVYTYNGKNRHLCKQTCHIVNYNSCNVRCNKA